MIETLALMANKLGISETDAILIWCYNRGFANRLAARKLYVLMGTLVERFKLDNLDMNRTYGMQLESKGVLTHAEALLFSAGEFTDGMAEGHPA